MNPESYLMKTPIFTTREFAGAIGTSVAVATRKLKSLETHGTVTNVTRGIWGNRNHPSFSSFGLVPFLLGPEQGYVSFLSALSRHDVISQIPQKISVATTGHGRILISKLGAFEFYQLKPEYMQEGIEWFDGGVSYAIASPEKALLDCLYVSSRRGRKFAYFPELNLSGLDVRKLKRLTARHKFPPAIRSYIEARITKLWAEFNHLNP